MSSTDAEITQSPPLALLAKVDARDKESQDLDTPSSVSL